MKATRTALIVTGTIAALFAAALLSGAVWIHKTNIDSAGYMVTDNHRVQTVTQAFASRELDVNGDFDWFLDRGPELRVAAESSKPLFIGIARSDDIERYLSGVAYDEVTDLDLDPFAITTERHTGTSDLAAPSSQTFWAASVQGTGPQTLSWDGGYGQWAVVVMNADGSPGVDAEVNFGAHVPYLTWVEIGGFIGGGLLLVAAAGLFFLGVRPAPREHDPLAPTPAAPAV
jgi:hypothetical protein